MARFELGTIHRPHATYYDSVNSTHYDCYGTIVCDYTITRNPDSVVFTGTISLGGKTNYNIANIRASGIRFVVAPQQSSSSISTYRTGVIAFDTFDLWNASKNQYVYDEEHKQSFSLTVPLIHTSYDVDIYLEGALRAQVYSSSYYYSELLDKWPKCGTLNTIAPRTSYTVKYAANGASSAPESQIKWHNEPLTLKTSSDIDRTGYIFAGWKATNGTVYASGASYTANAETTLTAQWTPITYTVAYNGNGNTSGSTASTKHTYDNGGISGYTDTALRTNGFTRTDYLFRGWATTQARATAGTIDYTNGQAVKNLSSTSGATVNLFAVWGYAYTGANIRSVTCERVDSSHALDDVGTYAKVTIDVILAKRENANGTYTNLNTRLNVYYKETGTTNWTSATSQTVSASDTYPLYFGGSLSEDKQYDVRVIATGVDGGDKTTGNKDATVYPAKFIVDFSDDYDSIGVFVAAPDINDILEVKGDFGIYLDSAIAGSATGTDDQKLKYYLTQLGWLSEVTR